MSSAPVRKIPQWKLDMLKDAELAAAVVVKADEAAVKAKAEAEAKAKRDAVKLAGEVETLVGKGPAMSSLPRTNLREVMAIYSVLIPRAAVQPQWLMLEVPA